MRILLAAVFVCAIQSCCVCSDEDSKMMARAYPVQKKIPFHRNIQILNAQKFVRSQPNENMKKRYIEKVKDAYTVFPTPTKDTYTVFPSIPVKSIQSTPIISESPDLPIETLFDQKPRIIKRMLPDYDLLPVRYKRSANFDNITKLNVTKSKTTKHSIAKGKERKSISKVGGKNVKAKTKGRSRVTGKEKIREVVKNKDKTQSKRQTSKVPIKKGNVQNKQKANPKSALIKNVKNKTSKTVKNVKKNIENNKVTTGGRGNSKNGQLGNTKKKPRFRKHTRDYMKQKIKRSETDGQVRKVNVGRRVIAGKDALIEEYPYVVSIQKRHEHWCAGALINPRIVVTTANCVWKSQLTSRLKVRAGSRHADRGGQVAGIQEMMRHSGWSIRHDPDNDVALLLLDRLISFSNRVHSVDLPNRAMMPPFDDAWVTSWGSDRRDGIYQSNMLTLQVYHARVMDHDKCNNITQRFGAYVSHNFFCMSQVGRRSPCTRDTGAPAVSDGVLWGLASWGLRKLCGTERFPAMFTYIASDSIMNFIENATAVLMSDERFYPFPDRIRDVRINALMANASAS